MIPITKPYITPADQKAVSDVVGSGWILQGPKVLEFEKKLGAYIDTPYAVATSSCTTAMHLGLLAAGIGNGDEIIVPSFSFIASANCIVHAGATPVFADINPKTYNIDPIDVVRKITKKTRAILVVHQVGLPADMEQLSKIARVHKLLLFEDCACGLGAKIHGKHVGTWGVWGAFSFHPRKAITTAEGGLLVTKNKKIAETVSLLRAHGASIDVKKRDTSHKVLFESYPLIGYNFRMSDIHAALGISQFKRIRQIESKRQNLAQRYTEAFATTTAITTPFVPKGYTHAYQSYVIRIRNGEKIRNHIMQYLLDRGIATRAGVMASHYSLVYRKMYPKLSLPETERAASETIALPLYQGLTKKEQNYVIKEVIKSITHFLN